MKVDWKSKKIKNALGLVLILAAGSYLFSALGPAALQCIKDNTCDARDAEYERYLNSLPVEIAGPERNKAEKGDPFAQAGLGDKYDKGVGVKKNPAESEKWFSRAAPGLEKLGRQGNLSAQENIAEMYAKGHGVKQDYAEAMKWYRMGADRGYYRSSLELSDLYSDKNNPHRDYAEAYFLARQSEFELGDIYSQTGHAMMGTTANAIKVRLRETAGHLSAEQKSTVDKRVTEWVKSRPAPVAKIP